ncbi:hypothetical protein AAFF_G00322580 [Aldrovandia affinis]|uniref:Uncharacterized protein n=1 Tax=Aldrovandia affinis TaxID=143900 RepID=A0AAD7WQ83_9TELE|nr:hypothetical protein AAFF_G00322580 [Aldrovandia affinis]
MIMGLLRPRAAQGVVLPLAVVRRAALSDRTRSPRYPVISAPIQTPPSEDTPIIIIIIIIIRQGETETCAADPPPARDCHTGRGLRSVSQSTESRCPPAQPLPSADPGSARCVACPWVKAAACVGRVSEDVWPLWSDGEDVVLFWRVTLSPAS